MIYINLTSLKIARGLLKEGLPQDKRRKNYGGLNFITDGY
jgi:hypothetical protein